MKKTLLRMISVALVLAFVIMLIPSNSLKAASVTYKGTWGDNLEWELEDGVLTIYGKGEMKDGNWFTDDDPECGKVTKIVVSEGITSIGDNAFYREYNLKSVVLPSTLKTIGQDSFMHCTKLESINFPKNLTEIGFRSFKDSGLKKVKIPSKIKEIKKYTFEDCVNLKSVTLNKNLEKIDSSAFLGTAIKSITIPKKCTELNNFAFADCKNLKKIKVASGNKAFVVENGVLFNKDKSLLILYPPKKSGKTYEIPATVTEISGGAFSYAKSLKSFTVASGNTSFVAENGILFSYDKTKLVRYPTGRSGDYEIPESVTELAHSAFKTSGIVNVTLPSNLEKMGLSAFSNCKKLSEITIPDKVKEISGNAFIGCDSLKKAVVGEGVEVLATSCFEDCIKLSEVTVGSSLKKIDGNVFRRDGNLKKITINSDKLINIFIGSFSFEDINEFAEIQFKATDNPNFKEIKDAIIGNGQAPKSVTFTRIY